MKKIAIFGAGAFGCAVAKHLSRDPVLEGKIVVYDVDKGLIAHLQEHYAHPHHFSDVKIAEHVQFTTNQEDAVQDAELLIMVTPAQVIRELLKNLKPLMKEGVIILNMAKGLEKTSNKTVSEIVREEMGDKRHTMAVFSGGTIAADLARGVPLGADIACEDNVVLRELKELFGSDNLVVRESTDIKGVEYAGAFKNVVAIGAGVMEGLKLPYGSQTALISLASGEAQGLAVKLGAHPETFGMATQCWGNDLWMSCTGDTRNRYFGKLIGSGKNVQEALAQLEKEHKIAEGYHTAKVMLEFAERLEIALPLFEGMYRMLYEGKNPEQEMLVIMKKYQDFAE